MSGHQNPPSDVVISCLPMWYGEISLPKTNSVQSHCWLLTTVNTQSHCRLLTTVKATPASAYYIIVLTLVFLYTYRKRKWLHFLSAQVKTAPSSSLGLDLDCFVDRERADLLDERLDRRALSPARFWRNLRCMSAFLRLRFVNNIPVNIMREATSRTPPIAYLTFLVHDLCAAEEDEWRLLPLVVEERRLCIAEPSVHKPESRLEHDSV